MNYFVKITILFIIFLLPSFSEGAKQEDYYKLNKLSSIELLKMASVYINEFSHREKALACCNIVANRYRKNMSKKEKLECINGLISKYYIYSFMFFDQPKSYESLCKAKEICDNMKIEKTEIYVDFGCMYQMLSEQYKDIKTGKLALYYYRKAFYVAKREKDNLVITLSFTNMANMAFISKRMSSIDKEWHIYKSLNIKGIDAEYCRSLYDGLQKICHGQYKQAIKIFEQQIQTIPVIDSYIRNKFLSYNLLSNVYYLTGDYGRAIKTIKNSEILAEKNEMVDGKLDIYKKLSLYYNKIGDNKNAELYQNKYYKLKDTLFSTQQIASLNEMKFLDQVNEAKNKINKIEQRNLIIKITLLIILLITLLISIFLFILSRKNRRLKENNEFLYKRTINLIKESDEEKDIRKNLEVQLNALKDKTESNNQQVEEKYKNSDLDNEDKIDLIKRILDVMNNIQEICSPNFSVERLAQLTNGKYRYISQVINERFNCNFNIFVSEYRIKEACRRLNDLEQYGNMTIEGISNSVGFKSRTTFIMYFKRFTGMSPSEYLKIVKKHN
jgi:AraC-like DNA-binding protein